DWTLFEGDLASLESGLWEKETGPKTRVLPLPTPNSPSFSLLFPDGRVEKRPLDCAFPVLHGKYGEDGTVQGLLALCGIPTVGCLTCASALCMDKAMTKAVLRDGGIDQARGIALEERDLGEDLAEKLAPLGLPLFVKPARSGSSVGVSKVRTMEELLPAVRKAFLEDSKILVEEFVDGIEAEVAVLEEEGKLTVSLPAEIIPGADFYDYETKYVTDTAQFFIPARIGEEKTAEIREKAGEVFRLLGCTGMARVDFFVRKDGKILLNEVNTIPGFTSISMYPRLMTGLGMSYGELLDRLIASAIAGQKKK
ncbi:MAG: D-alanine--D-alanine ligase, partial [Clostridia bacterium]|nr:D-alanine--D-alanine ligase [Clostridia bacterium]